MSVRFLAKCVRATRHVGRDANVATTLNDHARYAASSSTPGGSALAHRPDVRMIVPGGGIGLDGERWIASGPACSSPCACFRACSEDSSGRSFSLRIGQRVAVLRQQYLAMRKPSRPTWRPRGMGVEPSWLAGQQFSFWPFDPDFGSCGALEQANPVRFWPHCHGSGGLCVEFLCRVAGFADAHSDSGNVEPTLVTTVIRERSARPSARRGNRE
jgi:hypothetical protein